MTVDGINPNKINSNYSNHFDNDPFQEVFFCKMCDVSCPTGKDTLAHLSSKEHEKGPALKVAERDTKETEGEEELDASEITKKFFCDVCRLVGNCDAGSVSSKFSIVIFCGDLII